MQDVGDGGYDVGDDVENRTCRVDSCDFLEEVVFLRTPLTSLSKTNPVVTGENVSSFALLHRMSSNGRSKNMLLEAASPTSLIIAADDVHDPHSNFSNETVLETTCGPISDDEDTPLTCLLPDFTCLIPFPNPGMNKHNAPHLNFCSS